MFLLREWSIEHLPYLCLQCGKSKGLLEEGDALVQRAVVADVVLRVARHVQHSHIGASRSNSVGQFAPVHSRHDDVRQQQVNGAFVCLGNLDGGGAVGSIDHAVSLVLERLAGQAAQVFFVLYEQNGFMAGAGWLLRQERAGSAGTSPVALKRGK